MSAHLGLHWDALLGMARKRFSGKTIVPFCTHGTGGLAGTIQDLTAALPPDVTILDAIGVCRPDVDSSQPMVREWISGLDLGI